MSDEPSPFLFLTENGCLKIPIPIPLKLACSLCSLEGKKLGRYGSRGRVQDSVKHLKDKHVACDKVLYCCISCTYETPDKIEANRHQIYGCSEGDDAVAVGGTQEPVAYAQSYLRDKTPIYQFPCGPSRCPLCRFVSTAGDERTAATSINHHLFRVHQIDPEPCRWLCKYCKGEMSGKEKKRHDIERCKNNNSPHSNENFSSPSSSSSSSSFNLESDKTLSPCPDSSVLPTPINETQLTPTENGQSTRTSSQPTRSSLLSGIVRRNLAILENSLLGENKLPREKSNGRSKDDLWNSMRDLGSSLRTSRSSGPTNSSSTPNPFSSPFSAPTPNLSFTPVANHVPQPDADSVNSLSASGQDSSQTFSVVQTAVDSPSPSPPSPPTSPSNSSTSSASSSTSNITSEYEDPNSSTGPADDEDVQNSFRVFWIQKFNSVNSLNQLNTILQACVIDWFKETLNDGESTPVPHHPAGDRPPTRRKRNQTRQQQKVRHAGRANAKKKSHIQRLYSLYPRRAVRKLLDEKGVNYSGDKESAEKFLQATYHRSRPSGQQLSTAKRHFDECQWKQPTAEEGRMLSSPPTAGEIQLKLGKATNTAPGKDGLEYRHLRAMDPRGELLAAIFQAVWKWGIPACWKTSRTIPIYKKGDAGDYGNFRPISLLPTMYKIFSGVLASRIMNVAISHGWMSAEQKGFLPGVRGIQEHTHILHTSIEEAKHSRRDLTIVWLDLCNAFGSIPHDVLNTLFASLPLPDELRGILHDIYANNIQEFSVGNDTVTVFPTTGVRQGDPLSSVVFNLAAEPLIRTVKRSNSGFRLFDSRVVTTAYADDIAVIGEAALEVQQTLAKTKTTAADLGLAFNPSKCSALVLLKGKCSDENHVDLKLGEERIRVLADGEQEHYLGTPMGSRLTFRPVTSLAGNLIKIADSGLAPWQKLEVFRNTLLPSMSHHLASGRAEKDHLHELDVNCKDFLRNITNLPVAANSAFFYADRRVGGLGALPLSQEADIWTLSRALQLLDSHDEAISKSCMAQLEASIKRGYGRSEIPYPLPINEYLAGSDEKGLRAIRHGGGRENLWTRARKAAGHLKGIKIDVSGEEFSKVIADDISAISMKAVRGLRTALRQRWTNKLLRATQGKAATGLALDCSKDTAAMISYRTTLSFQDWHYIHRARLCLLPVKAIVGSTLRDKSCRLGCGRAETTQHVLGACRVNLSSYTERHDSILKLLAEESSKLGHRFSNNQPVDDTGLKPDLMFTSTSTPIIVDVTVPYDSAAGLEQARVKKIEKYQHLGTVLPLVVGSLGSWLPTNDEIGKALGFNRRRWAYIRRRMRLLAIQGSTRVIEKHLAYQCAEEGEPSEDEEENIFYDTLSSPSS